MLWPRNLQLEWFHKSATHRLLISKIRSSGYTGLVCVIYFRSLKMGAYLAMGPLSRSSLKEVALRLLYRTGQQISLRSSLSLSDKIHWTHSKPLFKLVASLGASGEGNSNAEHRVVLTFWD